MTKHPETDAINYPTYLALDELLSLQRPRSSPEHPDELLFIVVHQASELWFKVILADISELIDTMERSDAGRSLWHIQRINALMHIVSEQLTSLDTLPPQHFAEFRNYLGRSSGSQSVQFRALEAASLGVDVIWAEFNNTEIDGPQAFAEGVHKHYPDQMLGFNLSPSLHWGKAKKEHQLITNKQLGELGYVLQFSTLLAFRTIGMALEDSLKKFRHRGLDALADVQLAEIGNPDGEPTTRMHQKFAGTNRWLTIEKVSKGA